MRAFVTPPLVGEAVAEQATAGASPALPLSGCPVAQSRSPAVADIIGARLAWMVAMISSVSMPCR